MTQRIVILGGHGKVAQLLAPKLKAAGFAVDAVIRNPDQRSDIEAIGGHPVVLDMESASIDDFAKLFAGASAIVFSAGAGGDTAERTRAVDFEAATRTMEAAEKAGVKRYVMVSYARAADHYRALGPNNNFYPYAKAKHDADAYLRASDLDYTIVGPGTLTLEPATRKLQLADAHGEVDGDWPDEKKATSRDNVAEVIAHAIEHDAAVRQTVNFYDGGTPLEQALEHGSITTGSVPGEVGPVASTSSARLTHKTPPMGLSPFHLAIPVYDLSTARRFYGEVLGLEEGRSSAQWVDFNFHGHQLVIHEHPRTASQEHAHTNPVDGHDVPVPHFGIVLDWEEWEALAERLKSLDTRFVIEPGIRFKSQVGEQATLFLLDPCGNALEFKAFKDPAQLFAK